MEILDYRVVLFFQKVSPYNILCGDLSYERFDEANFKKLVFHNVVNMSESETDDVFLFLQDFNESEEGENGLNVFRSVKSIAEKYLELQNDVPVCKYDDLLTWKELVERLGEDLLVCAFLVRYEERTGRIWRNFTWNPILAHNNVQLNRIMQRGISDNHFHLFGAAPSFKLVWLRLMNNFEDYSYDAALEVIDHDRRVAGRKYFREYKEDSLIKMRFQAAVIRVYLISYIRKVRNNCPVETEDELDKIQKVLLAKENGYQYYAELELCIEGWKLADLAHDSQMVKDYACIGGESNSLNSEFVGERHFIYQMLKGRINNVKIPDRLMNWFYAYLVIQSKFRMEFAQVNEKVGFENFSRYNSRKNYFLNKPEDMKQMVELAVGGCLYSGNMQSLELRITPCESAVQNKQFVEQCDYFIRNKLGSEAVEKTYYVFHFPKRTDSSPEVDGYIDQCRHYEFRRSLELKSEEIIAFRNWYQEQASRVLGIDACAQELFCRPEVFGPVFRKLKQHIVSGYDSTGVHQLKVTYHVGEDWHDIVDGLRAIDEAVLFLNLKNGERLGHATVLGIDIDDWYEKKKRDIWISYQDYLDNIVWLYFKLNEFNIRDCEALKGDLLSEYEQYFQDIFGITIGGEKYIAPISMYYASWKLRGDEPVMYRTGEYVRPIAYQAYYYLNEQIENGDFIRQEEPVASLVYLYHYSATIRRRGQRRMHKNVSEMYIKGVKLIQKNMQKFIARKGIFIEANPSSNYKISTISKYAKHPITNFFNMGLTLDREEQERCPQIHTSINTDDKGVFDTSEENEYALMGSAMEQLKDQDGNYLYNKQRVYEWLDRIRENGNQQSFMWEKN